MKFLIDANLPRPLVRWLAAHGDETHYTDNLLGPAAADDAIWRLALSGDFIIVSKDADFADRALRAIQQFALSGFAAAISSSPCLKLGSWRVSKL